MTKKKNKEQDGLDGDLSITIDQEKVRYQKWTKLAEEGVDLFPHRAAITHTVSQVKQQYESLKEEELEKKEIKVSVPGRVLTIRRMGRATFFHLGDALNRLQGYLRQDQIGQEAYRRFSLLDIGDIISIQGRLFRTRTGELTVLVEEYTFLAKCFHPLPEKWHGLQDVELRYRKRYLDLMINPEAARVFWLRSALIAEIRRFFDERGYIEVETPMMHPIPGGALARPFETFHNALGIELYLRIAPELYLKRLVVGGFDKVYEINRNFRNEGISSQHNPEFTMLEFYEAYKDYHDMMEMTEELLVYLSQKILGTLELTFGEYSLSLKRPWRKVRFYEALAEFSGLSPAKLKNEREVIELASQLASEKTPLSYGKALDVLFDKQVKPKLIQPTFVINPPKEISPLAKASPENPNEAERFELIMAGMEIANAFSELTDPLEQKRRFEQQLEERKKGDEESHAIDLDYVQALEYGLPPTGGEGIGIDRLTMIFANKQSIREVILFPLLRPKG
ncbi:MAG: lysine--tRNA ligase [Candidatus Aminicenantes bacterium 4484_214]|nr:MAG: lysine--tRNA ligase [Candidatus Aminicenantes bacterium 4484_214]